MTKVLLVEAVREEPAPFSKIAFLSRIEALEDAIEPEQSLNIKLNIYRLEEATG